MTTFHHAFFPSLEPGMAFDRLAHIMKDSDAIPGRVVEGDQIHLLTDVEALPCRFTGSVVLLGNFDGFHLGHQTLLAVARAKALATGRPIGVMSVEPHPKQFFAPHAEPFRLYSPTTKRETFSRLGLDFLYTPRFDHAFAGQEPEQFINDVLVAGLAVSAVATGHNFRFGRQRRGDVDMLRRFGKLADFEVIALDEVGQGDAKYSSSLVRRHLIAGNIAAACALLGGPWSVKLETSPLSLLSTGEAAVVWPEAILRPACGSYRVQARQAGTGLNTPGRLVISPCSARLALQSSKRLAPTSLIVDFLANGS